MSPTVSRRDFLRCVLSASLTAPLWDYRALAGTGTAGKGARVVVIGAGAAGLAAAGRLAKAGFVVTVLEGRNRIGGRIYTDRSTFGCPVELGAQFIHGRKNGRGISNPIWAIARAQGWSTVPFSANTGQNYRNGVEISDREDAGIVALEENFLRWVTTVEKTRIAGDVNVSLQDSYSRFVAQYNLNPAQESGLRAYLAADVEGDLGADLSQISVASYDEDSWFPTGGDQIITGGYDQLPAFLAEGLDVRTGCVVESIDYSTTPITINTGNAGVFQAEYALVTVPLGVLKKGAIAFTPALPGDKAGAIARMQMGVLDKVILQFSNAFWPAGNWFTNIVPAAPFGETFSSLEAAQPGSNILVEWTSGAYASNRESLGDDILMQLVSTELRNSFGGVAVPAPVAGAITRWSADPFSFGSYSFPCVGSPRSDITTLAAPVNDRLYFAGEATSFDYPNTVHGAYLSGLREANAIMRSHKFK